MGTKLERISQLSRENPDMVFTSIGHLINKELLRECHEKMDGKKAVGIDGITKEEYSAHLEENLKLLEGRIKNKSYKPRPARKVEIPKEDGKTRPLSIYCYEDKLVQEALRLLNTYIEKRYTGNVVDADIRSFFNNLDHEWAVKFIESKIKDPNRNLIGCREFLRRFRKDDKAQAIKILYRKDVTVCPCCGGAMSYEVCTGWEHQRSSA